MFDRLMWFLRTIRQMMILPLTKTQLRRQDEDIARGICAYLSRGNVSLQQGLFVTAEEIEQLRHETLAYRLTRKK
ncbi:MAG: hypothetical protein LBP75_02905 [Planctomycetota bacterium]|jgi:hypothetical protein|nr:hypothetical protein [Planctomycetota bacterium]